MAINFPNSPTVGQVFTSGAQAWSWDGVAWIKAGGGGGGGGFLPLDGGTLTGPLVLTTAAPLTAGGAATFSGTVTVPAPASAAHAATKGYIDGLIANTYTQAAADARFVRLSAGPSNEQTVQGHVVVTSTQGTILTLLGSGGNTQFTVAGSGAVTAYGHITLNAGNPTQDAHAASKGYVDTRDALKVNRAGDTMTGALTVGGGLLTVSGSGGNELRTGHSGTHAYVANFGAGGLQFHFGTTAVAWFEAAGALTLNRADNGMIRWVNGDLYFQHAGVNHYVLRGDGVVGGAAGDILNKGYGDGTYALRSRVLTAGNGLTGGGALTADRAFALGIPGSITSTSANSVSASSHTHELATATVWELMSAAGITTVGGIAMLRVPPGVTVSPGGTRAGSGFEGFANASGNTAAGSPAGAWRCLGYAGGASNADRTTIYIKIA